jgi:hypothetical protein
MTLQEETKIFLEMNQEMEDMTDEITRLKLQNEKLKEEIRALNELLKHK